MDVIIIGGGIVGLAVALQLKKARTALSITLLEKEPKAAMHQTGNNSGVIHSGLYYKPGSLKALNCLRGYKMMVEFCQTHDIPYELTGKIVVASEENELPLLKNLLERGKQNGLEGLTELRKEEIKNYEPHAAGLAALFVPQTGIADYGRVAEKMLELLLHHGVKVLFNHCVTSVKIGKETIVKTDKEEFVCKRVINCAGLYSDKIAAHTIPDLGVKIIPFRGEYYKLKKEKEYLVRNLIYPVPNPDFPFLGVHFTRMAKGGVEAGPNAVLAFSREGYRKRDINLKELTETLMWPGFQKMAKKYWRVGMGEMLRSFSKAAFAEALQKLIPEIKEDDLTAGGSGVRAQACDRAGGLLDDFLILEKEGVVNVCNAPSPAATSSLAIGETVAGYALKRMNN